VSDEKDKAATDGAEGAEEEVEGAEGAEEGAEDFDKERALKTIRTQREAEKRQKEEIASLKAALAEFQSQEEAEAEGRKTLEEKLADAKATIKKLEDSIQEKEQAEIASKVRNDFVEKAAERGYASPALAFLAAREQGLLGEYDPKTGTVGDHDFETLEESHDQFATEAERTGGRATGDAGTRGGGKVNTPSKTFNDLVRGGIS
jgi:hypothetical protein